MNLRTDLEYRDGKLAVREQAQNSDSRQTLPEVEVTDRLGSEKWHDSIAREAGDHAGDLSLTSALDAHTRLVKSFNNLRSMRDNQSPDETQSKHLDKVARQYDEAAKTHAQSMERARNTLKARRDSLEAEFRESVGYDNRNVSELRAIIRDMPQAERSTVINQAIADKDGQVIAALLDAHPLQLGMEASQIKAMRDHALRKHRPDLAKLEKSIERAKDLLFNTFNDFLVADETLTAKQVRAKYEEQKRKAYEAAKSNQ